MRCARSWLSSLAGDRENPTDLVIGNYVYEKVHEGTRTVMGYFNVFPPDRGGVRLGGREALSPEPVPAHAFGHLSNRIASRNRPEASRALLHVDNIFVYVPLPFVDTMRYRDVDMYRYFIGREDQSVNESVMMGRIDQQLRITRFMIDAVRLPDDVVEPTLRRYMLNYLSMMMCICSIFCRMIGAAGRTRNAMPSGSI